MDTRKNERATLQPNEVILRVERFKFMSLWPRLSVVSTCRDERAINTRRESLAGHATSSSVENCYSCVTRPPILA